MSINQGNQTMNDTPNILGKEGEVRSAYDNEQQKIAECLSSVDELIAAQTRKLDALKTHKKGLMQQLFPAEGETLPRLRFPDFCNDSPGGDLGSETTKVASEVTPNGGDNDE